MFNKAKKTLERHLKKLNRLVLKQNQKKLLKM